MQGPKAGRGGRAVTIAAPPEAVWPFALVVDVNDVLFMRKQSLGIKQRAGR